MLAIVPVGAPEGAKRRLEPALSDDARIELVRAMLDDVVAACRRARSVQRVVVVTPEPRLAPAGVDVHVDAGAGHAAALHDAMRARAGAGVLVVMADCPLVTGEALDALCEAARPVAIAPAQDGGTNAIALAGADGLDPAFGVPDGAAVTVERARRLGIAAEVVHDHRIALDVDTPDDLARVLELGLGTRTWAFLDRALRLSAQCDGWQR